MFPLSRLCLDSGCKCVKCTLGVGSLDVGSLDVGSLDVGNLDVGSLDVESLDVESLDSEVWMSEVWMSEVLDVGSYWSCMSVLYVRVVRLGIEGLRCVGLSRLWSVNI